MDREWLSERGVMRAAGGLSLGRLAGEGARVIGVAGVGWKLS